jgi:hypothetical protein
MRWVGVANTVAAQGLTVVSAFIVECNLILS